MPAFTRRPLGLLSFSSFALSAGLARAAASIARPSPTCARPDQMVTAEPGRGAECRADLHFDGAKNEDAVLLIVGEGPGTTTPAEVK